MNLDKASQWIIAACLIGLTIMVFYLKTQQEWLICTLLVPVALMLYAKRVNKKELEEIDKEK